MSKRMWRRIKRPGLPDDFVRVHDWTDAQTFVVNPVRGDEAIFHRLTLSLQINRQVAEFWDDWPMLNLNDHLATGEGPPPSISSELHRLKDRPMPWEIPS